MSNPTTVLKRIDINSGEFEANGKTYYIESGLSVKRFCEFQILEKELAMGMSVQKVYETLGIIGQLLNQIRFKDAAVQLDKILHGMAKLPEKEPVVFKICTLFLNTKDENRADWGNDLVVSKMNDWKAEGIDVNDFFTLAFNLVPGYTKLYKMLTQDILGALE